MANGHFLMGPAYHFAEFFLTTSPRVFTCRVCGDQIPILLGFHIYSATVDAFMRHSRGSNCPLLVLSDFVGEFDPACFQRPADRIRPDNEIIQRMPQRAIGYHDEENQVARDGE